ncbi:MAG: hypothetical protein AAGA77_00705 [Bacteroidota bacterium]
MNRLGWIKSILIFFVMSRIILLLLGVGFEADYDFMYFHSIDEIRDNFWESFLYTHAFNPCMNILAGIALNLPEWMQIGFYHIIFYLLSILLLVSMGKILEIFGFKEKAIVLVLAFFSITPAFIYFESLLIYTMPSSALLACCCYFFYQGLSINTVRSWAIFFTMCALLSFVRSSFHLIWIVCVLIGTLMIDFKDVKSKLLGFALPFTLIFIWNLKNYFLFGFFGISSWGGFNFHYTTTARLTPQEKDELVQQGIMSPLVKIPIYDGVDSYFSILPQKEKTGINVLDDLDKNERIPNYNHINFIELSSMKMKDNKAFIKEFPFRYSRNVVAGITDYHTASTRWHPRDETNSPHQKARNAIGWWENIYNRIVHFPFTKGMGFYLLFLPIVLFSMLRSSIRFVQGKDMRMKEKLLTFINWNIFYLMLISCLITYGELERYRFITESLIWISVLVFLASKFNRVRNVVLKMDSESNLQASR